MTKHLAQDLEIRRLTALSSQGVAENGLEIIKSSLAKNPYLGISYGEYLTQLTSPKEIERIIIVMGNCQTIGICSLLNAGLAPGQLAIPIGVVKKTQKMASQELRTYLKTLINFLRNIDGRIDLIMQPILSADYIFSPREIMRVINIESLAIIPSLYFTCFWPWCFSSNGRLLEIQDVISQHSVFTKQVFRERFESVDIHLDLAGRLDRNLRETDNRIRMFVETQGLTNETIILDLHHTLASICKNERIMWTCNHPTTLGFMHCAARINEFLKIQNDFGMHDALRQRSNPLHSYLLQGHASRLDQLYSSFRLLISHMDTPYSSIELSTTYDVISPYWAANYMSYLELDEMSWHHF